MARSVCAVVLVWGLFAGGAAAQEVPNVPAVAPVAAEAPRALFAVNQLSLPAPQVFTVRVERSRPASLVPMYVSFAALQGMDYVSTRRAIASGAGQEGNPVMRGVAGNPAAFVAIKAGTTVLTTVVAERMWKKHPVRAVALMLAANATLAVVVSHNMSVR